jgi:hypothetical protein
MKAYLYDTEYGLYEGETFIEADMLEHVEGITTIAAPPYEAGQIPVFDPVCQAWRVVPKEVVMERLSAQGGKINTETTA